MEYEISYVDFISNSFEQNLLMQRGWRKEKKKKREKKKEANDHSSKKISLGEIRSSCRGGVEPCLRASFLLGKYFSRA